MSQLEFSGKTVLVTGGSSGIGFAVAAAFAGAGAEVVILASDDRLGEAAERLCAATGRQVKAVKADIADAVQICAALEGLSQVDILVNNAGFGAPTPITDSSAETERTFRRIIDVNLIGTYLVTREVVGKMPDGGRILITGSIVGRGKHLGGLPAYAASKAGLQGLTQALAVELGPRRITVNCVCPGTTRVPWMGSLDEVVFELEKATFPKLVSKGILTRDNAVDIATMQMITGEGFLDPESLAPAYLFLASPGAAAITGQCIHVDRGDVMR